VNDSGELVPEDPALRKRWSVPITAPYVKI
jgi:hypothetical protein